MDTRNKLIPFVAVHPGFTLREELESRCIKHKDFAKSLGVSVSYINEIINGKRPISNNLAESLERELGIKAKF